MLFYKVLFLLFLISKKIIYLNFFVTIKVTNITSAGTIIGIGFFHETGYLVTNSHFVDIEWKIEIEYYDVNIQEAFLAVNDITSDIAKLERH